MTDYYKPQPQPPVKDPAVWAMAVPLVVYSIGTWLYGMDAFTANEHEILAWGSWLMIFGGEANSLMTAIETYRKNQLETASVWDWAALVVSMLATAGALFVTYTKINAVDARWYDAAVMWGPLVLLVASVLDNTLSGAQVGSRVSTYEQRFEKWALDAHNWQLAQERKAARDTAAPVTLDVAPVAQTDSDSDAVTLPTLRKGDFMTAVAGLNGDTPRDADAIAAWCRANGYSVPSRRTLYRWAADMAEEVAP